MDINKIIRDSIPSNNSNLSSIKFESIDSTMRNIVFEEEPANPSEETPASKWKSKKIALGLGGGGVAALGTGLITKHFRDKREIASNNANIAKRIVNAPQLHQIKPTIPTPTQVKLPSSNVADISKNTLSGKSGDAAEAMGKTVGQGGQLLKTALGGVADFAARNPIVALAGGGIAGLAALKKLRRRE